MEVDTSLSVQVLPPMPLLDVSITAPAKEMKHGEVQRVEARIKNIGGETLSGIVVRVSHPSFVSMLNDDGREIFPFTAAPNSEVWSARPALGMTAAQECGTARVDPGSIHLNIPPLAADEEYSLIDLTTRLANTLILSVGGTFLKIGLLDYSKKNSCG